MHLFLALATSALIAGPPASTGPNVDNTWFPLEPGTTLRYRGQKDGKAATDVVTVTSKTKTIQGIRARVVHDRLYVDGVGLVEDTLDWYAQDRKGNVWYMGERTKELDGRGRVITREGSWQAGVDGAIAGIFLPAHPKRGERHRQEYWKGHAEDHFQIVNVTRSLVYTKEWSPLEPGVRDRKVYRRGLGLVLEETVRGGSERFQLVSVSKPR
jgi:hypothetical protein